MRYNFFLFIFVTSVLSLNIFSPEILLADEMTDLNSLIDAAENQQIDISQITKNKTAEQIAEQTAEIYNSCNFQKKLKAQVETLKSQFNQAEEGSPVISMKEEGINTFLMPDEKIYLFISSSMPKTALRSYLQDLDKLRDKNIIIVMRGFIGGIKYIKPTLEFIESIQKKVRPAIRKAVGAMHSMPI